MSYLQISEAARQAGMNMRELADRMGLNHQTVLYWNQGRTKPDLYNLLRVARICRVDVDFILAPLARQVETDMRDARLAAVRSVME